MNQSIKLLYLFIIFCNTLFSQSYDGICQPIQKVGFKVQQISYTSYSENYIIKEKYKHINEVKNTSPEELIKSQISATNNKWLSKNYGKEMTWTEGQFERLHEKGNALHLIGKLIITYNDEKFAVLKFNMNSSNKKIPASLVMKKRENNWFFCEDSLISNLSLIFMSLSGDDLYSIFNRKKSKSIVINELINNTWKEDSFNYSNFLKAYAKLLFEGSYKNNPKDYTIDLKKNKIININKV